MAACGLADMTGINRVQLCSDYTHADGLGMPLDLEASGIEK
jgi:hypothetical protein